MAKIRRIPELDSLRGMAAVGIVLWHYSGHFHAQPISILLYPFYNAGRYLVDLFFVLSGFVLTMAYLRPKRQKRVAKGLTNRIARLYPLHLVTLILVMLGQVYLARIGEKPFIYNYNNGYHFVLNLLMAQDTSLQKGFSFNGPAWAISVLLVVNVLFFFVAFKTKHPWAVFVVLMLLSLLSLVFHQGQLIPPRKLFGVFDGSLLRASLGFFTGAVFYGVARKLNQTLDRFKTITDGAFVVSLATTIWFFCGPINSTDGLDFLLVLVVFPVLIYGASHGRIISWLLNMRPLTQLGKISYSVYLTHFPLQLLIHIALVSGWVSLKFERPTTLLGFIAVLLIISTITYYLIELPGKKLLREVVWNRLAEARG